MRCDHTDWVHNQLTVTGPEERVRAFRSSARGCGAVPWVLDYDQMEEELVSLLLQEPPERRTIGLEAAKMIARQVRDFVQDGTEAVHAAVGVSTACSFDLHSLVPVPWRILRLGPDHPDAVAWLWANWGTTWTLRRVEERPVAPAEVAALPPGTAMTRYAFWSADWAPWQALRRIRADWPALAFRLRAAAEPPSPAAGRRRRPAAPPPASAPRCPAVDPVERVETTS